MAWSGLSPDQKLKHEITRLYRLFKEVLHTSLRHKTIPASFPKCDIAIILSTSKPGWKQPMSELISRLSSRGVKCAYIEGGSLKFIENDKPPGDSQIKSGQFADLLYFGVGRFDNLLSLLISIVCYIAIAPYLLIMNSGMLKLVKNPVNFISQLYNSRKRLKLADATLKSIKPAIIITNGDHAKMSSEFVVSKYAKKSHRVWFYNEVAHKGFFPAVSDEIWVCNEKVSESLRAIPSIGLDKIITITGKAEVDFASNIGKQRYDSGNNFVGKMAASKAMLFLGQYAPGMPGNVEQITREVIRWLLFAAKQCPEWNIIYKSRPMHHGQAVPGLENVRDSNNFVIPEGEASFNDLLRSRQVKVVSSLHSLGLYVAAGVGKLALRLNVSNSVVPEPTIDNVAVQINSPEELVETLRNYNKNEIDPSLKENIDTLFPYRGQVMDRIEELCLERLRNVKGAKINDDHMLAG